MTRSETRHEEMLKHLLARPHLLGIEDRVIWSATEVNVYRPGTSDLATQIDLLFKTERGIYVAEYKSGENHRITARAQLEEAEKFIKREFGESPTNIYVHGANVAYEIIRGKIK